MPAYHKGAALMWPPHLFSGCFMPRLLPGPMTTLWRPLVVRQVTVTLSPLLPRVTLPKIHVSLRRRIGLIVIPGRVHGGEVAALAGQPWLFIPESQAGAGHGVGGIPGEARNQAAGPLSYLSHASRILSSAGGSATSSSLPVSGLKTTPNMKLPSLSYRKLELAKVSPSPDGSGS